MDIGIIRFGKMTATMAQRLIKGEHRGVGIARSEQTAKKLAPALDLDRGQAVIKEKRCLI